MKDRVDQDEALARLGAPLLQRDSGAPGAGCPGADILAGYLDRSLDTAERARCEEHFAACDRCQSVLAGLARIEAPSPGIQPERAPSALWHWPFRWQWLAPAAAVVAVGVLWTLVRPTITPVVPPMVQSQVPSAELRAGAATGARARAAEGEAPTDALKQPAPTTSASRPRGLVQQARTQAESKEAAAMPPATRGKREAPAPSAPAVAQNMAAEPAKDIRTEALAVQRAADAVKPAAAPAPTERAVFETQAGAPRADTARLVTTAGANLPATIVVSPVQAVAWRVGPAGSIEQSIDGRRTWQKQDSGVSATLSAGSAPSETVCWVVGQHGTVLRTADGHTWETVSPPAPVDLVSVSAHDRLVATVVAADGRRFVTIDGGRNWRAP